jgi:hypothetical protein
MNVILSAAKNLVAQLKRFFARAQNDKKLAIANLPTTYALRIEGHPPVLAAYRNAWLPSHLDYCECLSGW